MTDHPQFSFPASEAWARPFLCLLRGHREEIILRDRRQLHFILAAAEESARSPGITPEIIAKLSQLKEALKKKIDLPGTKAQLKPSFVKKKGVKSPDEAVAKEPKKNGAGSDEEDELTETERTQKVESWLRGAPALPKGNAGANGQSTLGDMSTSPGSTIDLGDDRPHTPDMRSLIGNHGSYQANIPEGLEKMQLVVKWGGESTHSSRYQARDLGDAFKKVSMA